LNFELGAMGGVSAAVVRGGQAATGTRRLGMTQHGADATDARRKCVQAPAEVRA
jgi:hypothetical protein